MAAQEEKRTRLRSPAYPGVNLEEAVKRAEEFKQYAGNSSVTASHVLEKWGYKGNSGNGMKVVAALGE